MKSIYKYPVKMVGDQLIKIPVGAEILHVDLQFEGIYMWALCDPSGELEERKIVIIGTGHPIPNQVVDKLHHLGTVPMSGGSLIWHIFEEIS